MLFLSKHCQKTTKLGIMLQKFTTTMLLLKTKTSISFVHTRSTLHPHNQTLNFEKSIGIISSKTLYMIFHALFKFMKKGFGYANAMNFRTDSCVSIRLQLIISLKDSKVKSLLGRKARLEKGSKSPKTCRRCQNTSPKTS